MLDRIIDLLPECLQKIVRPELDHLIADFSKLDTKLSALAKRKLAHLGVLNDAKRWIEQDIAGVEHELSRLGRVADRVKEFIS